MSCNTTFTLTAESSINLAQFLKEECLKTDKKEVCVEKIYQHIKKHLNKKKEYGILLDRKLEPKEYLFGNNEYIPIEQKRYGGTLVHNHPKPSLLSNCDISCVVNKTFNAIACCVKIDNKIYLELFKRKNNSDRISDETIYDVLVSKNRNKINCGLFKFMSQDRSALDYLAKEYNYIHKLWRIK